MSGGREEVSRLVEELPGEQESAALADMCRRLVLRRRGVGGGLVAVAGAAAENL